MVILSSSCPPFWILSLFSSFTVVFCGWQSSWRRRLAGDQLSPTLHASFTFFKAKSHVQNTNSVLKGIENNNPGSLLSCFAALRDRGRIIIPRPQSRKGRSPHPTVPTISKNKQVQRCGGRDGVPNKTQLNDARQDIVSYILFFN